MDFISAQMSAHGDIAERYAELGRLFERKLWHQLTVALEAFAGDPACLRGDNLFELYEGFIRRFEGRMNQIKFVQLCCKIAEQMRAAAQGDADREAALVRAAAFLAGHLEKKARLGSDATLLCRLYASEFEVQQAGVDAQQAAKATLDDVENAFASAAKVDDRVRTAYHKVATLYYKKKGPAASFYRHALLFCDRGLADLPDADRVPLAVDIALAALVGEGIYNFGEVLANPLLGALDGSDFAWLRDLLRIFNHGDVTRFNEVMAGHSDQVNAQPALVANESLLKEKIALLALMELVFRRPADERTLAFGDIAAATLMPLVQVEWLLMRAMSLGLIKGEIDEIAQVVHVSWLLPRVLDRSQLESLRTRLAKWSGEVHNTLLYFESQCGPELFQ